MNTKQKIQSFVISKSYAWNTIEADIVKFSILPLIRKEIAVEAFKGEEEDYGKVLDLISKFAARKKMTEEEIVKKIIFPWAQKTCRNRLSVIYGEEKAKSLEGFDEFTKNLLTEKL